VEFRKHAGNPVVDGKGGGTRAFSCLGPFDYAQLLI
jgi:hypothetical protein